MTGHQLALSSCFDSGNGKLESLEENVMRVSIADDPYTEIDGRSHKMWFHFKVSNLSSGLPLKVILVNAGDCSYPGGWGGEALKGTPEGAAPYKACYSVDRKNWRRLQDTQYLDGELHMSLDPKEEAALSSADTVYLAYFAPYSQEQHMDLMSTVVADSLVAAVETIGQTLDGADMEVISVKTGGSSAEEEKKKLWFIARQHPGESQASWWMEGFVRRILDPADPVAAALLAKADVYICPMMNPDGARRGYLRTNAAGANLNREWAEPKEDYSPEVFHILRKMHETGMDFGLDVHGDEALPFNFISGSEGCPCWSDRLASLQKQWCDAYQRANPDFQQVHGYPIDAKGKANLKICSNALTQAFDALVMTLEMPFKDNANAPDQVWGWSAERCEKLGESSLDATLAVVEKLR